MLANKAAGVPGWFHPGSLTSGARYANSSAGMAARQAAYGTLAAAWHLYTGSRPAECFRLRWGDTGVPGAGDVPVWALGLAGTLQDFQGTPGTGFYMINYHCKNGYDYGAPDYVDVLPGSCSGLCLAAIINLCFVVLTYLQPQSPARPVVQQKRGQQPKQTLNNPQGFVWGCYGGLQHVPDPDAEDEQARPARRGVVGDGLADVVNAAISGASGFLGACWAGLKASGATLQHAASTSGPATAAAAPASAPAPAASQPNNSSNSSSSQQKHNKPSYYRHRAALTGEVTLLMRQVHASILPADLWDWYMVRAGRSQASNSFKVYVANYTKAFGDRMPYLRDLGCSLLAVPFKPSLLSWLPSKVNQALVSGLPAPKAVALKSAQKLAAVYRYNKSTPDMWQHLMDTVQQQGSLAGMLRLKAAPLLHSGYRLAAPAGGCDLQHLGLAPRTCSTWSPTSRPM